MYSNDCLFVSYSLPVKAGKIDFILLYSTVPDWYRLLCCIWSPRGHVIETERGVLLGYREVSDVIIHKKSHDIWWIRAYYYLHRTKLQGYICKDTEM